MQELAVESENIYTGSEFLEATGGTWRAEDSPWKAAQVMKMIERHNLTPTVIGEVGCGSGVALSELSQYPLLDGVQFVGYDISPHAVSLAKELESETVQFHLGDPLTNDSEAFDILVALDVFEHVPDYMGSSSSAARKQHSRSTTYHSTSTSRLS